MPTLSGQTRRSRQPHHFLAGNMYGISPEQLRAYVNVNDENTDDSNVGSLKHRVLVLDCRSFVAFNSGHIIDAVNVHCPAILRRRCGGRLPLRTIIPNSNIRSSISNNHCFPIVLYDDFGQNVKNLSDLTGDESTAAFVAKCLRNEANLQTIYYLEGGYQTFSHLFPELVFQSACATPSPINSPAHLRRKTAKCIRFCNSFFSLHS
uniref:Dual specificity protein phosphatase 4 n=1 Tax=Parasteatoda tepidariorum TaxID=114398 RepID=A0A2L2Y6Z7_PARTP